MGRPPRLARWLALAAYMLLGASLLVATASVVAAARGAAVSGVGLLIGGAFALWLAGTALEGLARVAWLDTAPPSAGGPPTEEGA